MQAHGRRDTAIRVLALLSAGLAVLAVLEAAAIRQGRAELQQLRAERDEARAGIAASWARQSAGEFGRVVLGLNDFYKDGETGFGRPGGLCAAGQLDVEPIVTFVFGSFLPARGAGRSTIAAVEEMMADVRRSDAYREVRPALALPPVRR
jgi:hypothetical protein